MPTTKQRSLTRDDWARAALAAIARGGIDSIGLDAIASELGATKGSFYWHFENRDSLIEAALERWEQRTESIIAEMEREPDPAVRLRTLLEAGIEQGPSHLAEVALLANPNHPAASRAVRRVAKRRRAYITQQLAALGWSQRDAYDRAVLLGYVYVGNMQMAHVAPRMATAAERRRQARLVYDLIAARSVNTASAKKQR